MKIDLQREGVSLKSENKIESLQLVEFFMNVGAYSKEDKPRRGRPVGSTNRPQIESYRRTPEIVSKQKESMAKHLVSIPCTMCHRVIVGPAAMGMHLKKHQRLGEGVRTLQVKHAE